MRLIASAPGLSNCAAGSILAGKLACFVVLGDDPATVAANAIRDVPVPATILSGQVIRTSDTRKRR